ncbi:MAG: anhydro-N-acetylmuramic acid kinase [Bauldia sp.]
MTTEAAGLLRVVGLMSGTSLDGVDAAVLETDGETIAGFGPRSYRPYTEAEREVLRQAIGAARGMVDRADRPGPLARAEAVVTRAHIEAVRQLLRENGLVASAAGDADRSVRAIQLLGLHGQTVLHAPERRLTVQIGDGQALADETGLPVVFDFRAADVAAGGQGAPLVPVYHRALASRSGLPRPLAVVNIGGVANVTWIGADDDLAASDVGPGNALLDDFVRSRRGQPFDKDGGLACAGKVDHEALASLLAHPWFGRSWPKSLDRNAFDPAAVARLGDKDGAATLVAFTAAGIARGVAHFGGAEQVVVVGGGARNPATMASLRNILPAPVVRGDEIGWAGDFVEAEAFAFLAARSVRGLPLTFPGTTGVRRPLTGGLLARPRQAVASAAARRRST